MSLQSALLHCRDNPISNLYSPALLLLNRLLNSIGIVKEWFNNINQLRKDEEVYREKHKKWYGSRHRVQVKTVIPLLSQLRLQDLNRKPHDATLIAAKGREAIVQKDNRNLLRRNRRMITVKEPHYVKPTNSESQVSGALAPNTNVVKCARTFTHSKCSRCHCTSQCFMCARISQCSRCDSTSLFSTYACTS